MKRPRLAAAASTVALLAASVTIAGAWTGDPLTVSKFTNGAQADHMNDPDVPVLAPGDAITWTYVVHNDTDQTYWKYQVSVLDDDPDVHPVLDSDSDAGGDNKLSPGESWTFVATGVARDLSDLDGYANVMPGCGDGRPTYYNTARATMGDHEAHDWSHYCNPPGEQPAPAIDIEVSTNTFQADFPNGIVPEIGIGETTTFRYLVTNTGNVAFERADVVVTDPVPGVVPVFQRWSDDGRDDVLSPGERWTYRVITVAEDLADPPPGRVIVAGCSDGRPTYRTVGEVSATAAGQTVGDTDPTHYCNPSDEPVLGSIGDRVFLDASRNGIQEDRERGVPGVTVQLLVGGAVVDTTTTDDEGRYRFAELEAGDYAVAFDLPSGYVFSPKDRGGDDGLDSDADRDSGRTGVVSLAAGENRDDVDAGLVIPSAIHIETLTFIPSPSPTGDVCDTVDKVTELELRYTGGDDTVISGQDPSKGFAVGDTGGAEPVQIVIADKDGNPLFEGTVAIGGTLIATNGGDNFDSETHFTISSGGSVLQSGEIHTSCSQPLTVDDLYGALDVVRVAGPGGEAVEAPTGLGEDADVPTGPEGTVGQPLTWNYVVTNPGRIELTQVAVFDDNGTPDTADDFAPDPVLDGGVNVGDDDGDGRLDPGEAWRYRAPGTVADGQYANVGRTQGKAIAPDGTILGFFIRDTDPTHHFGVLTSGDVCDDVDKPSVLTLRYTGAGADATSHSQDDSKVTVTGDPNDADPVTIIVYDKDGTRTYFTGVVGLGETFTVDTTDIGEDKFESETRVDIHHAGALVQSIRFHTSCSQPLHLGDRFGALTLLGVG